MVFERWCIDCFWVNGVVVKVLFYEVGCDGFCQFNDCSFCCVIGGLVSEVFDGGCYGCYV